MIPLGVLASSYVAPAGGGGDLTLDYGTTATFGTTGSWSRTQSTPAGDHIIAVFVTRWNGAVGTVSLEVGGEAATLDASAVGGEYAVYIFSAPHPGGATPLFDCAISGGVLRSSPPSAPSALATYAVTGAMTLSDAVSVPNGDGSADLTLTPTVAGGVAVAALNWGPDWSSAVTWSGATADYTGLSGNMKSVASAATSSSSTAISATYYNYLFDAAASVAYAPA